MVTWQTQLKNLALNLLLATYKNIWRSKYGKFNFCFLWIWQFQAYFSPPKKNKILWTGHSPPFFWVPQVMKISPPPQKKYPCNNGVHLWNNGISNHFPLLKGALTNGVGKVVANDQLHPPTPNDKLKSGFLFLRGTKPFQNWRESWTLYWWNE